MKQGDSVLQKHFYCIFSPFESTASIAAFVLC